jgi:hypothetical protein
MAVLVAVEHPDLAGRQMEGYQFPGRDSPAAPEWRKSTDLALAVAVPVALGRKELRGKSAATAT